MVVKLNGKEICTSHAKYDTTVPGSEPGAKSWTTIGRMTECDDTIPVKVGDALSIDATWDKNAHPL